jgi:hypothetical protein
MSHGPAGAELIRGWVILVIDGRGTARELTVCDDGCLDEAIIVHKRRAVPGLCEVCGVETQ